MIFSLRAFRLYLPAQLLASTLVSSGMAQGISVTQDIQSTSDSFRHSMQTEFQGFDDQLDKEFELYREIVSEEFDVFTSKVTGIWGNSTFSTPTKWIDYSHDLKKRLVIDFENGTLHFERVDSSAILDAELYRPLMAVLNLTAKQAFERDTLAQAIEKRVVDRLPEVITAEVDDIPVVTPLISGRDALSEHEKESLVKNMIDKKEFKVKKGPKGNNIAEAIVRLPKLGPVATETSHLWPDGAKTVKPYVEEFSAQEKIPKSLIYSIIDAESAFNPLATSHISAFGLMQIVPSTAGLLATSKKFGEPKLLAPSYLYNSRNNVELGSIHLNVVFHNYLKKIENEQSRLYCSIAVYKAGIGSLVRSFNEKTLDGTAQAVNAKTPEAIYKHLLEYLPDEETKTYLRKVNNKISMYSQ